MDKRCLVDIKDREFHDIHRNLKKNPKVQLLDWTVEFLGPRKALFREIRARKEAREVGKEGVSFEGWGKWERISKLPIMAKELTLKRFNCFTPFEKKPPLYFGIGGGSQRLCRGLPFDVLAMVLAGEKFRRELNLGKCYIVLANEITCSNIGKDVSFSKESINRVLMGEMELLNICVGKLGFQNWSLFLETDIGKVIEKRGKDVYEKTITDADATPFMEGRHYAEETGITHSLLGEGGVKLGWFIRNPSKIRGRLYNYIMDEQPFDLRYILYTGYRGIPNRVSFAYTKAGVRLFPGKTGLVEKVAPYLCYYPENRILLNPKEDPVKKLGAATKFGGGFNFTWTREFFQGICSLFEELILKSEISVSNEEDFPGERIAWKMKKILSFVFEGEEKKAEKIWETAFPETVL